MSVLGHLIQHRPLGPRRLAQHVVQGLLVGVRDHLFHPFHVLGFRLQQTPDVVLDRRFYRPGSLAEVTAEAVAEVQEPLTNPGQQPHPGVSRRVFLTLPAVLFMHYLIRPCLLIRDGLSSFIDNNQIDESDKVELMSRNE